MPQNMLNLMNVTPTAAQRIQVDELATRDAQQKAQQDAAMRLYNLQQQRQQNALRQQATAQGQPSNAMGMQIAPQQVQNYGQLQAVQQFNAAKVKDLTTQMQPILKQAWTSGDKATIDAAANKYAQVGQEVGNPALISFAQILKDTKFKGPGEAESVINFDDPTARHIFQTKHPGIQIPQSGTYTVQLKDDPNTGEPVPTKFTLQKSPLLGGNTVQGELLRGTTKQLAQEHPDWTPEKLQFEAAKKVQADQAQQQIEKGMAYRVLYEASTMTQPQRQASAKQAQLYHMSVAFDNKINQQTELAKQWIDKYAKENPSVSNRMGGILNDLMNGKIAASGDLANIKTLLADIHTEVQKLGSGSLGSAGVTKHAVDTYNSLLMPSAGMNNVKQQLGALQTIGSTIVGANKDAYSQAQQEYMDAVKQWGVTPEKIKGFVDKYMPGSGSPDQTAGTQSTSSTPTAEIPTSAPVNLSAQYPSQDAAFKAKWATAKAAGFSKKDVYDYIKQHWRK